MKITIIGSGDIAENGIIPIVGGKKNPRPSSWEGHPSHVVRVCAVSTVHQPRDPPKGSACVQMRHVRKSICYQKAVFVQRSSLSPPKPKLGSRNRRIALVLRLFVRSSSNEKIIVVTGHLWKMFHN